MRDKLGKIRRHHWNERLNISKIAKFESDTSPANEDYIDPQSWGKFTDVCMARGKSAGAVLTL